MSKRKTPSTATRTKSKAKPAAPTGFPAPISPQETALPPSRVHSTSYHYPLILQHETAGKELLRWFEGIEEARSMPWRKEWIDPSEYEGREEEFEELLAKRAYEVWVSEVMLQQTRVSTVIPYFNAWISKWPTVQALAEASHDDVLSVWKGLGYYSRATRLHEGAQEVVAKSDSKACKIPSGVAELQNIPGIGRYTAGAVSSIAFGEAEPVLDGNVARVLSRQLGLYVDAKDKKSSDVLWEVADQLVKSVAGYPEKRNSRIPGQWNQALMELGSTICTPRPKCDECPVRNTCRAYAEGETLTMKKSSSTALPDIEDACTFCQLLDTEDLATAPEGEDADGEEILEKPTKKRKTQQKPSNTISNYFTSTTPKPKAIVATPNNESDDTEEATTSRKRKSATNTPAQTKFIVTYCSLFPKKMPKKKVPEEDAVVCIVEAQLSDGRSKWLIEQRPAKGLLASLWQFPQSTLPDAKRTAASRKSAAHDFLLNLSVGTRRLDDAVHVSELGSLVHVFTHLKLTMHVQHFRVEMREEVEEVVDGLPARKWVETESMEGETLSTGMRKCWGLMQTKR